MCVYCVCNEVSGRMCIRELSCLLCVLLISLFGAVDILKKKKKE